MQGGKRGEGWARALLGALCGRAAMGRMRVRLGLGLELGLGSG